MWWRAAWVQTDTRPSSCSSYITTQAGLLWHECFFLPSMYTPIIRDLEMLFGNICVSTSGVNVGGKVDLVTMTNLLKMMLFFTIDYNSCFCGSIILFALFLNTCKSLLWINEASGWKNDGLLLGSRSYLQAGPSIWSAPGDAPWLWQTGTRPWLKAANQHGIFIYFLVIFSLQLR